MMGFFDKLMRVNYIIYPFVSMFSSPCRNSWQGLLLIIAV